MRNKITKNLPEDSDPRIYHLTLGEGKKLFDNGAIPAAFTLMECIATPTGVIIAHYRRAGEVTTGTVEV